MEFLTFHIGEREFAVDLNRVREIVAPPWITRVPGMPPALLGLAGLRGDPTAVVDAGLRLAGRAVVRSARSPLIVLRVEHQDRPIEVGLLVEAAGRKLELGSLLPWTDDLARFVGSDACDGFADVDGQLVIVLDVDRLLAFGRIAAASSLALPPPAPAEPRVEPPVPPMASPPDRRQGESVAPPPAPRAPPAPPTPASTAALASPPKRSGTASPARQPPSMHAQGRPVRQRPTHHPPAPSVAPSASPAPANRAPISAVPAPVTAVSPVTVAPARAAPAPAPSRTPPAPGPVPFARDAAEPAPRPGSGRLGWMAVAAAVVLALIAAILLLALGPADRRAAREPLPLVERRAEPTPAFPAPSTPPPTTATVVQPPPPPAPAPPQSPQPFPPPAQPERAAQPPTPQPAARQPHRVPEFLAVTPQTPACEIHEVKKGDTLWGISARRLGDPYRWPQLFGENRDHLFNPDLIEVDDRIRIPGACAPAGVK